MTTKPLKTIYLDYASTTPIDSGVLEKMYEYDKVYFANPSALYAGGAMSKKRLEEERARAARALQVRAPELFFTSGGTESDNLALRGTVTAFKKKYPERTPHIVVSAIEHAAILDTANDLKNSGVLVSTVPVSKDGLVRPLDVIELITPDTVIVSVMSVNNEIGTVQPVGNIGKLIREYREKNNTDYPLLHTDACQAGNYELVTAPRYKCDLLTINASKVYGPKGAGLLYVKSGVDIDPILFGGGQEKRLRSGTESVSLVIGLVESFIMAQNMREVETERLSVIQKETIKKIKERFPKFIINGSLSDRVPNNINITVGGLSAEELVIRLDAVGVSVSSKSACSSMDTDGSYVIMAIGGSEQAARETLRITMGRDTEQTDLDYLLDEIESILQKYDNTNL